MKLLFKQRVFSWLDSYDIYDESGQVVYLVKGQLDWGHRLQIYDGAGNPLATVREKVFTFLPRFELYFGEEYLGCISKEFSFFTPRYNIDFNGWQVEGNFLEWDYGIYQGQQCIATVSKQLFNWSDTYVIELARPQDALPALMLVLAIDAEKCSRNSN